MRGGARTSGPQSADVSSGDHSRPFVARPEVGRQRTGGPRADWRWLAAAAVVALACLAAAGAQHARGVTIVILPFDNFSGDPRNDVTAQAVTEDIINRVGGIDPEHIRVIDRLTAAKFRRTNECIIHIGQALRAQYVMEGSVQKTHATAALYRVADNTQVWATAAAPATIAARVESTFRR